MAIPRKKTYQYVMTADECQLFNHLRRLEKDSIEIFTLQDHPRLKQNFNLSIGVGGHIRHYAIDPTQIVQESACKAAEYLREVLTNPDQPADDPSRPNETTSVADCPTTDLPASSNDRDSVLGTQSVIEGAGTQVATESLSWEIFRQKCVPPCIGKVTFSIQDGVLTGEDTSALRERFPGVSFTSEQPSSSEPGSSDSKRQPRGVKSITIELDEEEIAKNPAIENSIREQYPWAAFQAKTGPNTSRKRIPRPTDYDMTSLKKLDPIRHLCDLAQYASEAPATQDFEVYNPQTFESWDRLTFSRKMEVAHARAIQSQYGKVVDGGGCGPCVEAGYKCKAYATELHDISATKLGLSCQNCRLKDVTCDLESRTNALHLDTREATLSRPQEATATPPTATPHKPSLASRMTPLGNEIRIRGAADAEDRPAPGSANGANWADGRYSGGSPILLYAESIGLEIPSHVRKVIHAMYAHLVQHREVKQYATRSLKLEHYYSNLITLYTLVYKKQEYDLAYIVLLRFQNTNYNWTGTLPSIELAVQAFEHLPPGSPLCRWVATLYSFLWGTQDDGHYNRFAKDHPGLNTPALLKLLYAVAFERDPFTKGHDSAVFSRWCEVHDHDEGSLRQTLCEKMQVGLKMNREQAIEFENAQVLAKAQETIKEHGGWSTLERRTGELSQGKRKAESSPARPYKKSKRGGGHGMSGR